MRMRLIDAESLKELFPDNGEGSWTYNATAKVYIDAQPTIHPDTTTHDSIVVKKGGNDEDRTSGDCISRQQAIDALCSVCNALGGGHNCDKTKFVYNAPFDEQVILCPEHYALTMLPSAQPEPERTMEEFMYGQDMGNPEDGSL